MEGKFDIFTPSPPDNEPEHFSRRLRGTKTIAMHILHRCRKLFWFISFLYLFQEKELIFTTDGTNFNCRNYTVAITQRIIIEITRNHNYFLATIL